MQIVAQNWLVALADRTRRSSSGSTRSCSSCRSCSSRSSAASSPIATIAGARCSRRSTCRWRRRPTLGAARCIFARRPDLAHPAAVVHHRLRAVVRRPGVSVADPVARRQEGSAERGRAQLDSVQRRARARPARLRRDAVRRSAKWGYNEPQAMNACFLAQLAVVPGRHQHADVAAREAHPAGQVGADARRAAQRALATCATTAASSR